VGEGSHAMQQGLHEVDLLLNTDEKMVLESLRGGKGCSKNLQS